MTTYLLRDATLEKTSFLGRFFAGARFRWSGSRQSEGEDASLTNGARHGDISLMGAGKGSCQAQAETCPGLGAAVVAAIESLEDMGKVFPRDADPRVLDRHDHFSSIFIRYGNLHGSP